jgi:hypothetical protein
MPRSKAKKARKPQTIQIGNKKLIYGKNVLPMEDSTDLYRSQKFAQLRYKLESDGYIFIRGVIDEEIVKKARTMMLAQAQREKAIVVDGDNALDRARMSKNGSVWSDGYCVDGISGSETQQRAGIDAEAWRIIGPSQTCREVYDGECLRQLWRHLFGDHQMRPLVKQTFLRLMGSSGTIEHADYYYFKRDTHIFSGSDGKNAQTAAKQYLQTHALWNTDVFDYDYDCKLKQRERTNDDALRCGICDECYSISADLDKLRRERLKRRDFAVEGEWHCPSCARLPLSIYTAWISCSSLRAPKDSILAIQPKSHRTLREWDLPKKGAQVPQDFSWSDPWVIPEEVGYGDVIMFNIKTIHASSLNRSTPRCFRCSFDTRLQLVPVTNNKEHNIANLSKDIHTLKL